MENYVSLAKNRRFLKEFGGERREEKKTQNFPHGGILLRSPKKKGSSYISPFTEESKSSGFRTRF
ncbi:hypothetical protein A0128_15940 [Leptospira tipperaryensis]|uniref:Uncharacterized protein n=1 Tax=Leptospira tipperaryensis TaxID=2564040 RepID=A0A1D7V058_9LEPT|nr:hypothetical protein A0128_15940 [Leptospira tipperaryensis]